MKRKCQYCGFEFDDGLSDGSGDLGYIKRALNDSDIPRSSPSTLVIKCPKCGKIQESINSTKVYESK